MSWRGLPQSLEVVDCARLPGGGLGNRGLQFGHPHGYLGRHVGLMVGNLQGSTGEVLKLPEILGCHLMMIGVTYLLLFG